MKSAERAASAAEQLDGKIMTLDASARVRRTSHRNGRLTWREWGEGTPLVLLHGSHGCWMHWLRNIPELARSRRVIAPDLPGFGESDAPAELESLQAHAQMLGEGLGEILAGSGPVDVLAFSLGAAIGCHLSLEASDLVRRLIIVDAGGLGTPMRSPDLRGVKGLTGEALRDANRHNLAAMMFHNPDLIDEAAIDIAMFGGRRVRTRVQFQVVPDKLRSAVALSRVPIDVIWGQWDYIHPSPEANVSVVREYQSEAQLRTVEKAGHWSIYEQAEAFNAAALELLATPARAVLTDADKA